MAVPLDLVGAALVGVGAYLLYRRLRPRVMPSRLPVASFDGDRLREEGDVAVLFAAGWCSFCRRFEARFAAWDAPAGVALRIGDVSLDASPLWRSFDLRVVPTVALFRDGRLVWRRDGRAGAGLGERDLVDLEAAVREP